ncbi:MAG TPA: helix-turn-helix transcriptional regulator [Streptosporangiaceae bacterium]|nr:helix-turn-helix transcriptional regulator [Streptosporangiaceae bacterium]
MAESARVVPLRRASQPQAPQEAPAPEPLWREVLGRRLRVLRQDQDETLAETAGRAGISPQYLSEIERGRKEPSSEMIAALAGALGTTLTTLTEQVAGDLRRQATLIRLAQTQAELARTRQAQTQQALAPQTRARTSGPVALAA